MKHMWRPLAQAVLVLTIAGGARGQCHATKLLAPDGAYGDLFGTSVALDGTVAVIGAIGHEGQGPDAGAAYVFRLVGSRWTLETTLLPRNDAIAPRAFGVHVATDGDVILVTRGSDEPDPSTRQVLIYRFDGVIWQHEATLMSAPEPLQDAFGSGLAVHGDVAVIGASGDDALGEDAGAVHVYRHGGRAWVPEATLRAKDGDAGDRLGSQVDIDGDQIVVGAPHDDVNGPNSGSAYVFGFDGTSWEQQAKLLPADGAGPHRFGEDVAIDGDRLLVGAPAGESAYIFRRRGTAWTEEAKLVAIDCSLGHFGNSVDLQAGVALVGAGWDVANGPFAGAAFVFRFDGRSWIGEAKILPRDGDSGDEFGAEVGLSGGQALVGAPFDEEIADFAGSAYVFDVDAVICPADFDRDGAVGPADLQVLLTAWGHCACCPEDLDADEQVGITDLLGLLANWGACP